MFVDVEALGPAAASPEIPVRLHLVPERLREPGAQTLECLAFPSAIRVASTDQDVGAGDPEHLESGLTPGTSDLQDALPLAAGVGPVGDVRHGIAGHPARAEAAAGGRERRSHRADTVR